MKTPIHALIIVALAVAPLSAQSVQTPSSSSLRQIQQPDQARIVATRAAAKGLSSPEERQTVFVIPASGPQSEDLTPVIEDLHVMCRIFDKMGSSNTGSAPLLGAYSGYQGIQGTEALYLQGYGIVFFVRVPLTLDFSRPEETAKTEAPSETDPVWQSVKEETLYGVRRPAPVDDSAGNEAVNRQITAMMTDRLVQTLKHASNIRSLKADEKIIVRLTGQGKAVTQFSRSGRRTASTGRTGTPAAYGEAVRSYGPGVYGAETPTTATTLIARATKADVDGYSKGNLTFDEFKAKLEFVSLDTSNSTPVKLQLM